MEAKALKSSVRGEFTRNSHNQNQHVVFDDFFSLNGVVSSEEFSVDCYFDFTNGEFEEEENEEKNSALIFSQEERVTDDDSNSNSSSFSFDSGLTNELSVPVIFISGIFFLKFSWIFWNISCIFNYFFEFSCILLPVIFIFIFFFIFDLLHAFFLTF